MNVAILEQKLSPISSSALRLKTVVLYDCDIGLDGVKVLAEAIKLNKSVEHLNLEENNFRDDALAGGEALIDALKFNVCITYLDVFDNDISDEALAIISYLTRTRNEFLVPAAVRQAALCLVSARCSIGDSGILSVFPKEIVKMIAMNVWATRKDPVWIEAVSDPENMVRQQEYVDEWVRENADY